MLYFRLAKNLKVVGIATSHPSSQAREWTYRGEFPTFDHATAIAASATKYAGKLYLATDAGAHTSPRYDVIEAPQVGDDVSKGFNGDRYPEGTITKISASYKRIETSTGVVFHRRRQTGAWVEAGTWTLVRGHHYTQNPSF
jgi:hypothetical protein